MDKRLNPKKYPEAQSRRMDSLNFVTPVKKKTATKPKKKKEVKYPPPKKKKTAKKAKK